MNIKSLLLGSAAAAVAFTGAQAADAIIIAEPEPMEYVRICDAYGAGYFYIPGTETCLRLSGWVRYQIEATPSRDASVTQIDANGVATTFSVDTRDDGWSKYTGVQINLDARSETEYGTLRGWIQLETPNLDAPLGGIEGSHGGGDLGIQVNRAAIQLGGLWLAYTDSLFSSSSTIGGSALGNYGGFTYADTFSYHYEQRHQIGYQFSGSNGFWGGISLEHDDTSDTLAVDRNYMPDVVGKVAWSQGWGGVWLAAAYDESADGAGVRGGVQGNFGPLTARFDAYYQSNVDVSYGRGARWAVQGTALYQINPQFGIAAGLEYRHGLVADPSAIINAAAAIPGSGITPVAASGTFFTGRGYSAQLGINWQPVQNFLIGADVTYNKNRIRYTDVATDTAHRLDDDNTRFRVRFQRNF